MILYIESDASYLSEPKSRSRVGGYFFLSNQAQAKDQADPPPLNGAIHIVSNILTNVMASAAEAEFGGLFVNGQEGAHIRKVLEEMGWKQPPTIIACDNQCAKGIATETVKQKRSKAMDMRFYWIRDRINQGQFKVIWRRGLTNLADYFTKHHSAKHHQNMRPIYLYEPENETTYLYTPHNKALQAVCCKGVLITD